MGAIIVGLIGGFLVGGPMAEMLASLSSSRTAAEAQRKQSEAQEKRNVHKQMDA